MLITLGYDVDRPWRELSKKDRDWILFTEEQPVVPVYAGYDAAEIRAARRRKEEPDYHGNFPAPGATYSKTSRTRRVRPSRSVLRAAWEVRSARYVAASDCAANRSQ